MNDHKLHNLGHCEYELGDTVWLGDTGWIVQRDTWNWVNIWVVLDDQRTEVSYMTTRREAVEIAWGILQERGLVKSDGS